MEKEIKYLRDKLLQWSVGNTRDFPWRVTTDPYRICVAEIMLQHTFARKVDEVYRKFIKRYPNVVRLSKARPSTLQKIVYPLGITRRSLRFKELAKVITQKYAGRIPNDNVLFQEKSGERSGAQITAFEDT